MSAQASISPASAVLPRIEKFEATFVAKSGARFEFPVSSSVGGGLVILGQVAEDKTAMACHAARSFLDAFGDGVVTMVTDLTARERRTVGWPLVDVSDERLRLICITDTVGVAEASRAHARPLRRGRHHARMLILICEEAWMFAGELADSWTRMTNRWWNDGRERGWGWDHETFLVLTSDDRDDIDLSGLNGGGLNELRLCTAKPSAGD